jgi:hypothetical protein
LCFRLSHKMVEADTSNQIWARDYITITAHSNTLAACIFAKLFI